MAVQEQTPYVEYVANGVITSFALGFDCDNRDHLIVLVDDVEPVEGAWSFSNGAVVFNAAPENGKKITIQRNTPFSRTTDYQSYNNSFRPPAVNNDFDRVWLKLQELGVKDWLLDLKIQKFRDDVNLTALENTLEEARQIRDDTADSVVEVQGNVAQSQTLLGNTTAQANLAQGYASSANSANAAAQQAATDVSTAKADVYSALSAQQIAVNNSLTAIAGGHKAYQTLAAAQAAQATLSVNSIVEVTNDGANNGTYQWNGTTLTKSAYDPLTQAKTYTDDSLRTLESNRTQNPNKFTFEQVNFTTAPTGTTGTVTYPFRNGLKQLKLVSATTGGSIIVYWDIPVSQFTREFSASITVEGLTSGSNGLVGIQQVNDANTILSSTYAATAISAAVNKQTYKVNVSSVTVGATKIRLIVNMQTTTSREMYVHSPFVADGTNAEFIAPVKDFSVDISANKTSIDLLNTAFTQNPTNNIFNPANATDAMLISYATGTNVAFANGVSLGKHAVNANTTYTLSLPVGQKFAFTKAIYTYDSNGVYLGVDHSIPSSGEVVNANPPTGIVYSDGNKTVTFTIPVGSNIAYVAMMTAYVAHTTDEFNALVNAIKLEIGASKTAFTPYSPTSNYLVLKPHALPTSSTPVVSASTVNTFTVTTDGTDAYVRTSYSASLDLVQKIRYGTNATWSNNIINPWEVRTILKTTAKDATISAFSTGNLFISQGDDAAPLHYNGTYIGANHGAFIAHEVTVVGHGKSFSDVGSRWTQGANTFTIVRIVDANKLWLVSQNVGTTYWQFVTDSLNGLTLTHSTGATNTASFTPSADTQTQLMSAVNNHTKRIVVDGFRDITAFNAVYDVQSVEFIDNYDIMNPSSILSYLQARTGTTTEQSLSSNSIASDMRVSVNYRYSFNGACVVKTQLVSKAALNFTFAGFTQAMVANYSGKTLLQYVNKIGAITGPSKTWNFANVEDITTTIDSINFLKVNWTDVTNPPDRMAQIVKNGATKEFGHVVGYSLARGISKPSVRQATNDAGFVYTSRKMYPKANTANVYAAQPNGLMPAGTVLNEVSYRSVYNSEVLPTATVYTWYEDNDDIYVVLDMHQNASMLTLPLPDVFNGKSATVIDSNANFTLHSEIVSDGGLLCSIINSYGQATIKLT